MLQLPDNPNFIDTLTYGLKVALLGIGTVFSVLLILWLILVIFEKVFSTKHKKTKIAEKKDIVEQAPVSIQPFPQEDECELVAVIMAAVYAATGAKQGSLRMISCKRKKTPWNRK